MKGSGLLEADRLIFQKSNLFGSCCFFFKKSIFKSGFLCQWICCYFLLSGKVFFSRDQEILGSCLIESLAVAGKAASLALGGKIEKTEVNPLSANPTKWSNTLKQFVGNSRRIVWVCLAIFVKMAFKRLTTAQNSLQDLFNWGSLNTRLKNNHYKEWSYKKNKKKEEKHTGMPIARAQRWKIPFNSRLKTVEIITRGKYSAWKQLRV